jgi:hypothetical protein
MLFSPGSEPYISADDPADDQWPLAVRETTMQTSWAMAAALTTAAFTGVAAAQERPPITPTKDVTVEYNYKTVSRDGSRQQGHSRIFSTAGGKRCVSKASRRPAT